MLFRSGNNFYRLKINLINGNYFYTTVKFLNFISEVAINIYPNPSRDVISLELNNISTSSLFIDILNSEGKKIKTKIPVNRQDDKIDIRVLSKGVYILTVYDRITGAFLGKSTFIKE